jgi:hypothetical protein
MTKKYLVPISIVTSFLVWVAVGGGLTFGQSQESRHIPVGPSTLAVLRLNVDAFDSQALIDMATDFADMTEGPKEPLIQGVGLITPLMLSLQSQGVSNIYFRWDLDEWTHRVPVLAGLSLHVPCEDPSKVKQTIDVFLALIPNNQLQSRITNQGVLLGLSEIHKRLAKLPELDRPSLQQSLDRHADDLYNLVVEIPARYRDEFIGFLPEKWRRDLTKELPLRELAASVDSIQVHGQANRNLETTLCIAMKSPGDARSLLSKLTEIQSPYLPSRSLSHDGSTVAIKFDRKIWGMYLPGAILDRESRAVRQTILAMLNFEAANKILPPRELRSADGKPLLSWRVLVLPYLDQEALYREFHLDEPWDSPHNLSLIPRMPAIFAGDLAKQAKNGRSQIVIPVMPKSLWHGEGPPLPLAAILDGRSNTLGAMLVPPEQAVIWTKPEELNLDEATLVDTLFQHADAITVGFLDGHSQRLSRTIDSSKIRAYLTHQGND